MIEDRLRVGFVNPDSNSMLQQPQFLEEMSDYLQVAGYNVFDNMRHQLNTRLCMDFLRMEGEYMFLSYLPLQFETGSGVDGTRACVKEEKTQGMNWVHDQPILEKPIHAGLFDLNRYHDL